MKHSQNNFNYKDRKYSIVPYDPDWPMQFNLRKHALSNIFGSDCLGIEHIGSTAVPGMDGKPTIDILVLVKDIRVVDKYISQLEGIGYSYIGEYVTPDSILFREEKDNAVLANVHVFPKDDLHVNEMLALRKYLRANPEEAQSYSTLKRNLAVEYPNDYASYRRIKDEFMEAMKKKTGLV